MKSDKNIKTIVYGLVFIIIVLIGIIIYYWNKCYKIENFEVSSVTVPTISPNNIQTTDQTISKLHVFSRDIAQKDDTNNTKEEITQLTALKEDLIKEINELNTSFKQIVTNQTNALQQKDSTIEAPQSENILESADIKFSQMNQDLQINKLKERLEKLKNMYNQFREASEQKVYNKIPVYSSCIIAEANGEYNMPSSSSSTQPSTSTFDPSQLSMFGFNLGSFNREVPLGGADNNPAKNTQVGDTIVLEDIMNHFYNMLGELKEGEININLSSPSS